MYDRDPASPTGYARRARVFADGLAIPLGILPFFALVAMTAFEFLVAVLQAYIFTILTAVYIGGSSHAEH